MGRLFWKVFFGFWLTILIAAGVTALTLSVLNATGEGDAFERGDGRGSLLQGRRVADRIERHAQILRYGGEQALRDYVEGVERRRAELGRRPPLAVLAVDDTGRELLGRRVPPDALGEARATAQAAFPNRDADDFTDPLRAERALRVESRDGSGYLLFMPRPAPSAGDRRAIPFWRRLPTEAFVSAGLVFSLLFSGALAWYLARPIRALRAGLRRVADGDLESRVEPLIGRRRDELADLGRDLDRTTERLRQLLASQRRLLHDVSHELRSPLARMQAAVGIMRQSPARLPPMLDRLEHETERLDALVGEILTLARLEETQGQGEPEPFDLRELLADVLADAAFEVQGREVEVKLVPGEAAPCVGHPALLLRALENLVRNAVRHSPDGGTVTVRLQGGNEGSGERMRVEIDDEGPGIAADQLERMLEPFVRGGGDDGQGFGLGLAIARRAIEIHHGDLRLINRAEGGLRAIVELPGPVRPDTKKGSRQGSPFSAGR